MSEPKRLMILLDAPLSEGSDGLVEIPIAITGSWKRGEREFSITKSDLAQMVANFNRRKNGEVNVDFEHSSEMPEVAKGGPVPSAGRIVKMRSNGALYAGIKFTRRALEMIQAEEYRFVSPAIAWGMKDKETGEDVGTALTSLALTNRPFLEELPQIKLSEISTANERAGEGGHEMAPEKSFEGAETRLLVLAQERMRESKLRFREALIEVAREHPDLAESARREVLSDRGPAFIEQPKPQPLPVRLNESKLLTLTAARQKEKGCRFSEALLEISRENPELAEKYRREITFGEPGLR